MLRKISVKRIVLTIIGLVVLSALLFLLNQEIGLFVVPDNSFLEGKPCSPPCWFNIVPDKTSDQTAWQILREHPNVNQRTLQRLVDRKGIEDIVWLNKLGGGQNRLYSRNGTIQAIYLTPDNNLNLGQVVSKMGNPEKVLATLTAAEQINDSYHIVMYYPRYGVLVRSDPPPKVQNGMLVIHPAMRVSQLLYLHPSSLKEIVSMAHNTVPSPIWSEKYQNQIQDWHGFGTYEVR